MAIEERERAQPNRGEAPSGLLTSSQRERVLAELSDLLASRHFKASRRCSEFLEYVVRQTLTGNLHFLKERALGIQLFHRPAAYDTNSDPVVRATAGEIRKKIAQHYQESSAANVRILLPVGSYVPIFHFEPTKNGYPADPVKLPAQPQEALPLSPPLPRRPISWRQLLRSRWAAPAAIAPIVALAILLPSLRRVFLSRGAPLADQADSPLALFWEPFIAGPMGTTVVFSSLGPKTGKNSLDGISYRSGISTGALASPGISGVGEVMGVHALDGVFTSFHRRLWVKRSSFFSFDDAAHENVIFLGSPLANSPLRLLQNNNDFLFQIKPTDSGGETLEIVNNHPGPNEPKDFLATPPDSPIKQDYAVIALIPGMFPASKVLVLAGITTFGTQAAAEFVSRGASLNAMLSRLRVEKDGEIRPFEAVISVKIDDEVPVEERIVAVHLH